MKYLLLLTTLLVLTFTLSAQQVGINLRLDAAKAFKLNKRTRIEISQQLQLNPEIKNINKRYYRIFDEFELFPFLQDEDDDDDNDGNGDDDDDNDQNQPNPSTGFNELNDAAYSIDLAWRTSSTFDFDYKIRKWLRFGQSYSLLLDDRNIRHLLRSDLTLQPKLPNKKLDLQYRLAYQLGVSTEKGKFRLDSDFNSRVGLDWEFKKNHIWFSTLGVNGAFDEGKWEWDRFRYDTGLEYRLSKTHSFSFGYRFQKRINRQKNAVSHGVSFAYSLDF